VFAAPSRGAATVDSRAVHEVVTRSACRHGIVAADMEARIADRDETLVVGEVEITPDQGLVTVNGRAVTLSVREFRLLVALARRAGKIVSREDLYAMAWEGLLRPGDRSVDVYVHKLRAKLEEQAEQRTFIHTHVGFGYRLAAEDSHPRSHAFHKT
jgi:DNA-binding response OmpR family regulator